MCFFVSKKGINFSDAKLRIFFGTAKKMWLDDNMLEGDSVHSVHSAHFAH